MRSLVRQENARALQVKESWRDLIDGYLYLDSRRVLISQKKHQTSERFELESPFLQR